MLKLTRPRLAPGEALDIATTLFGVEAKSARELPSERDQNFLLSGPGGELVLKLASASERRDVLDLQNEALRHVRERDPELPVPRLRPSLSGERIAVVRDGEGRELFCRLFDYLPGRPLASVRPHSRALLRNLGGFLARLDGALEGFEHPAQNRELKWDSRRADEPMRDALALLGGERRAILAPVLERYERDVKPRLSELPRGVIHNDGNDHNLLVDESGAVSGILDFGDALEGPIVADLANLVAYAMLEKPAPLKAAAAVVAGYHERRPLSELELELLFPLAVTRLGLSVAISARQFRDEPDKEYLRVSEAPAWRLLGKLDASCPRLALYALRSACGLEPHPEGAALRAWLDAHAAEAAPVLPFDLTREPVHVLDLSVGSGELGGLDVLESVERFSDHVFRAIRRSGARVGVGRYGEARPIYTSEAFLPKPGEGAEPRTVHLGVDLFVEPGTPVHAPFDGKVASFALNDAPLDYGPCILLEHEANEGRRFVTLYGHLSLASLEGLTPGKRVARGEAFAAVGDFPVNGNWPPHLHFQIVLDALDYEGDFPGVAAPSERALWLGLAPDPSAVLHLPSAAASRSDARGLRERRRAHLSRALSLSYDEPLEILRGYGTFLYDAEARPYLDMVNNVCHVGHAHPRVVRAASEQMAVLNTNTRYLHPNLVDYAERLLAKLPAAFEVVFFVNSGSEANDLALRLARAATGRDGVLVLDGAYHGNLTSLIGVSPYKFDGPGGQGAPRTTHVLPMPDGYRGRFRRDREDYGERYVSTAAAALERAAERGAPVGAFLAESIMSCGGQIVLPEGYLRGVYRLVREAGGVAIADEVQVGFGRVGSHFWGFQAEGAVPDIVTMGKPIGNGHPLGAVAVTRAVAESFVTGMEYFNTFGGNPVSCAAGLAVLDVLEDEALQENAARRGERLMEGLRELAAKHAILGDVRGRGLFLGFELVRDRESLEPAAEEARYLANRMKQEGVLASTDGPLANVIKLKPALVLSEASVERFLDTLARVLEEDRLQVTRP